MWNNTIQPDRPQMKIWCMLIACWITKATNTRSEYVILIAFLLQRWLQEHASFLRYIYFACLVYCCDVAVVVNNIKVFSVGMEVQQLLPLKLLTRYKVFCTTVNNNNIKHYECVCILAVLSLPANRIFSVP